jgi:hypothetical protein
MNTLFMKKIVVNPELLQLLVSVYNQSIQTYFHFPEVILCGRQRLEKESLDFLLLHDFIIAYQVDSFGKTYRLSRKGEEYLLSFSFRRRQKHTSCVLPVFQPSLAFG